MEREDFSQADRMGQLGKLLQQIGRGVIAFGAADMVIAAIFIDGNTEGTAARLAGAGCLALAIGGGVAVVGLAMSSKNSPEA